MFTASRIYLNPPPAKPAVVWLCNGAPGRAECASCARRTLLTRPAPGGPRALLQPWAGHGPCPDYQPPPRHESAGEDDQ
jgi:hypothetical protein